MGGLRRFRPALTLPALAITGVLLLGGTAQAGAVEIHDAMHVLSQTETSSVTNAASQLPDPVKIYTTNILSNDTSAFDAKIQTHITAPNDIVIGINTQSQHIAVRGGPRAGLSSTADITAITAFRAAYQAGHSYSVGLLGMLGVLQSSIHGPGGVIQHQGVIVHSGKTISTALLVGGLIAAVIGLIVIVAIVRGIGRLLGFGRRQGPPVYQQPGYGPRPGYGPGPGYGGGYGGGMSPGAAAGLGAVGGGLLGYELGRMEGEERREEYYDQGGYNQGGYDQGGYNQGGYNQGGYNQGGYDQGGGSAADGDFGGGGGDWGGGGGDSF
jgi:hypothetical protein